MKQNTPIITGIAALLLLGTACSATPKVYPFTDPSNQSGWVLNETMSDEFEGATLDENKWLIQGRNGEFRSRFVGRTYSTANYVAGWQFSPDNVRLEEGMLKITTRHEPDYDWAPFSNPGRDNVDLCEFTTGGISTKQTFTQGYMEIRCKLPDAKQTGAFWTTGGGAELDVFEAIGKHSKRENLMWSSIHDWYFKGHKNVAWTDTKPLPFKFADGFHTYAAEWDEETLKIYADGQLIHKTTKEHVESVKGDHNSDRWPMVTGHHIWVDSEIFPWWGVPDPANLPADFEVEYVRVWQKK